MSQELQQSITRGLLGKCPNCGKASIFDSWLGVKPACDECGLDLSREDSGDGASVFLIFGIGLVSALIMLLLIFGIGLPVWLGIAVMVVTVLGLTVLTLRPAKSLLIALAWHHNSGDGSAKR